jgi:hypothetical protein
LEWETTSIEPVPVKYMVVGVIYSVLGNETQVTYGHSPSGTYPAAYPAGSSDLGTRWRSIIRAPDGSEQVAELGPIDMGTGGTWPALQAVTTAWGALIQSRDMSLTVSSWYDVSSHELDQILVWLNPAAAVTTDFSGRKTLAWSSPGPARIAGPQVWPFLAGWLDGTVPVPPNVAPLLAGLDARDLSDIVSHDPFLAAPGRTSSSFAADPRYRHLGVASVEPATPTSPVTATPPTQWLPCAAPLSDGESPIFEEVDLPFGKGETLALQRSTLAVDTACPSQAPGLTVGTSTTGCYFSADVYVDTAYGTLLMAPTSVEAACTTGSVPPP